MLLLPAKDKDVLQPAQKASITWDRPTVETLIVQFEATPRLRHESRRPAGRSSTRCPAIFKELAVHHPEPMDTRSTETGCSRGRDSCGRGPRRRAASPPSRYRCRRRLSLDFKIITAEKADDLYSWLKENGYKYAGDEATLGFYIEKKWFFTVMKIDAKQMKPNRDGTFTGEVTPTRFTFESTKLVYPLKITQISVKDKTEALFYVQAPHKMDLPGDFSYQFTFTPMWFQASSFAVPEKLTEQEKTWQPLAQVAAKDSLEKVQALRGKGSEPATLEWARKITDHDLEVIDGKKPYNRAAPKRGRAQAEDPPRARQEGAVRDRSSGRCLRRARWGADLSSCGRSSATRTTT